MKYLNVINLEPKKASKVLKPNKKFFFTKKSSKVLKPTKSPLT